MVNKSPGRKSRVGKSSSPKKSPKKEDKKKQSPKSANKQHAKFTPPPYRFVPSSAVFAAYALALAASVVAFYVCKRDFPTNDGFQNGLVATSAGTFAIYVFSILYNNSSIYDPYWVYAPPILALMVKVFSTGWNHWHSRQMLVLWSLCVWCFRYQASFWPWVGWTTGLVHEDWRYEEMRETKVMGVGIPYWFNSLVGMHFIPTFLVYFAFAPAAFVLDMKNQPKFNSVDWLAIIITTIGPALQYVADYENQQFRSTDEYKQGKSLRTGVWSFSRHPNYMGEVTFWLGLIFFGVAAGSHASHPYLTYGGGIVMGLFFRGSSVLMDNRSLKRRTDYHEVMNEVACLFPFLP